VKKRIRSSFPRKGLEFSDLLEKRNLPLEEKFELRKRERFRGEIKRKGNGASVLYAHRRIEDVLAFQKRRDAYLRGKFGYEKGRTFAKEEKIHQKNCLASRCGGRIARVFM